MLLVFEFLWGGPCALPARSLIESPRGDSHSYHSKRPQDYRTTRIFRFFTALAKLAHFAIPQRMVANFHSSRQTPQIPPFDR